MDVFEFTKQVLAQTDKGMAILDEKGVIRYANLSFYLAAGMLPEQRTYESLTGLYKERNPGILGHLNNLLPGGAWRGSIDLDPAGNDGNRLDAVILRLESEAGRAVYLLSVDPRQRDGKASVYGTVDELTGLPKEEIFLDRVEQFIRFSRREKSFAIMFLIRIDRFNLITDGLGHANSDLILKAVAGRLRQIFRESDTIARVDRDTFGLLLKVAQESHASLVADKVLKNIIRPIPVNEQTVVVSASIGIVSCHGTMKPVERIVEAAEAAMHHASEQGGNMYHFFASDLNDKARKRIEMENNLRTAVEAEEFVLYYQPKVDIDSSRIVGAEALIRWQHPQQGMVPPFQFIPVAEETGLIIDIGRWVLKDACRQTITWQQQGLTPVPVAVNVSPRQFQYPGFYEDVSTALRQSGLDPHLLELEITESMLMSDVEQVIDKLRRLTGVGLNLAIDDFGTGYSNLSYLVRFPVSTLKIDRTFVKDLETDDSMAGLTHSIIAMSKNLNLKIVAEGAENEQHIQFLKDHGCDVVQGYYYSKPVPAEEFAQLLKTGKIKKGV
ncbi:MAG TPA: signal transduction protein [Desulfobacteraceae bacterium]|nr:signal transduction protein [Desulfobacteraceae bacterium]